MGKEEPTSLARLTTEIVLRCTAKVCHGFAPWRIEAIAAPLGEALIDIIVSQGNSAMKHHPVTVSNYSTFELWNQILDEIQKEIPCANQLDAIGERVTRAQRAIYLEGAWRTNK